MNNENDNKPTINEIKEHKITTLVTQNDEPTEPEAVTPNESEVKQEEIEQTANKEEEVKTDDNNDLAVFIGNNYQKITTKPFNFASFFFTSFYMFYRKMIIPGILFSILSTLVTSVIPIFMKTKNYYFNTAIIYLSVVIIGIISGFIFNKMYVKYANKQITKIKNQNSQKSPEELHNIILTRGGTSFGLLVVGIIIAFAISGISSYVSSLFGYSNNTFNITKDDDGTSITELNPDKILNSGKYQGVLYYDANIALKDKIDITIPEGFETINSLFESMASYYETNVNTRTINGNEWLWIGTDGNTKKKFYYGISKNEKLYIVEYGVEKEESRECEPLLDEILNSINLK